MKKRLKTILHLIKKFVKHNRNALLVSCCNVIILFLLSYMLNNQPLFTGEDLNSQAWLEWIRSTQRSDFHEVVFVNVAYDKQLVIASDEYGMPIGNIDITDRYKLLKFLKMLRNSNSYRYIFLDVRFEKGCEVPEIDSILFDEIHNMRNIVIANHSDIEIADSILLNKAAISDYKATIVATNFVRYKYTYNGQMTMPLYAYQELTGNELSDCGLFHKCNGRMCYNSCFVHFPVESFDEYNDSGIKKYYNLGNDLLDAYSEKDLAVLTEGKYIVIGDMIEDLHDTYSGVKPGPVITYYAFKALMRGEHFVSFALQLLISVVYFFISFAQFTRLSLMDKIPFIRNSKYKILHFVTSFIGYTFVLSMVVILLSAFFEVTISILIPSFYFAIQKIVLKFKRGQL